MSHWNRTGVFATEDEVKEIRDLVSLASAQALLASRLGPALSDSTRAGIHVRVHELAIAKGLPEITGCYGLANNGEFIQSERKS